jgi:hypothetical protein
MYFTSVVLPLLFVSLQIAIVGSATSAWGQVGVAFQDSPGTAAAVTACRKTTDAVACK